jgi:hypothetical protein
MNNGTQLVVAGVPVNSARALASGLGAGVLVGARELGGQQRPHRRSQVRSWCGRRRRRSRASSPSSSDVADSHARVALLASGRDHVVGRRLGAHRAQILGVVRVLPALLLAHLQLFPERLGIGQILLVFDRQAQHLVDHLRCEREISRLHVAVHGETQENDSVLEFERDLGEELGEEADRRQGLVLVGRAAGCRVDAALLLDLLDLEEDRERQFVAHCEFELATLLFQVFPLIATLII